MVSKALDEEEEYDYDDPRFEATPVASTSTLTYAEKRNAALRKGLDKGRTHAPSRKQREVEAREEGLSRNLLTSRSEDGGAQESTALKMMR